MVHHYVDHFTYNMRWWKEDLRIWMMQKSACISVWTIVRPFFLCFSFCTTTGFHDKDIFDAAAMAITGSWPCGALVAGPHASLHDGLQSEKSLMLVWKDA